MGMADEDVVAGVDRRERQRAADRAVRSELLVRPRRHHENLDAAVPSPQLTAHLETVHIGEPEVEHDQIGRSLADDLEGLSAVPPRIRLVKGAYAEPTEIAFQKKSIA